MDGLVLAHFWFTSLGLVLIVSLTLQPMHIKQMLSGRVIVRLHFGHPMRTRHTQCECRDHIGAHPLSISCLLVLLASSA